MHSMLGLRLTSTTNHTSHLSPRPGQTVWACKICKVRLCKAKCFHRWDHDTNCAPCNRVLSL